MASEDTQARSKARFMCAQITERPSKLYDTTHQDWALLLNLE